jgi:two-component system sensor histidine kinase and response regulator WspE
LPLTLSVISALLFTIGGEKYALPLSRIDQVLMLTQMEIQIAQDRQFCTVEGKQVGLIDARQVLGLPGGDQPMETVHIVIISDRLNQYGLVVEQLMHQQDLVVIPLDARLGKVPDVSAGAILEDGTPILILDTEDLVRSIDNLLSEGRMSKIRTGQMRARSRAKHILVVDDSLTVRQVERKLLESRGYQVTVAVDGVDGWNTLQSGQFDLMVTDVDMPRMNGIELVRQVKASAAWHALPILIVSYKDREEDRMAGLEAGANYYLTKSSFHDERLLGAVRELIGDPWPETKSE